MPKSQKADEAVINEADKTTLHDAGVDVKGLAPAEEPAPAVVDIDGGAPTEEAADSDLQKTGIKFVESAPRKEDLSALAEQRDQMAASTARDLEDEFKSELSGIAPKPVAKPTTERAGSLKSLLDQIREKLGLKKKKVKDELDTLKKMKEGISADIADIKELEESEGKIEAGLQKMDSLAGEMEAIEKEVGEELKK